MEKEGGNLPFCNGSSLKNRNIEISLSPDIAFRLERLAEKENKVIFGGRLGEYKYYDMDQVIAVALQKSEELFGE